MAWLVVAWLAATAHGLYGQERAPMARLQDGLSEPGLGDQYLMRHWTTQHGLPQNTVTCLAQTPDGYLWLGTRYGLVRHDGLRPSVFLKELENVATDAVDVRQLVAEPNGGLWILTRRGLYRHRQGRFVAVPMTIAGGTEPLRIEAIAPARAGGIYLGGPGGVYRMRSDTPTDAVAPWFGREQGFHAESVASLFEDRRGRVWVQTVRGAARPWVRFDSLAGRPQTLHEVIGGGWPAPRLGGSYEWEAVWETRDGRLWAASPDEWAVLDDGGLVARGTAGAWGGRSVRILRDDIDGHVWMVTEGETSLFRFDGRQFQPMQLVGGAEIAPDLRALFADREGNVWLGTGNAGVYQLRPRPLLARRPKADLSREEVFSIVPGNTGGAWVGTLRGIVRVTQDGSKTHTDAEAASGPRCKPVLEDRQGRVWTGVFGGGLARLEGAVVQSQAILSPAGSTHWQVRCLFEAASGTVWVGANVGLLRLAEGGPEWITRHHGLSAEVVLALAETPDGTLWVGTDGGGLNRLRNGRWQALRTSDGLLHDRVWPLTVEADGTLWLGTPLGLNRIRGERIDSVTPEQGLPTDLTYSLLDDGLGWYWSHGNHGLSRIRKDPLHAVADGRESHVFCIAYDESDGMESTEGNGDEQPSAARLANGELWFPTTRGVVVVDPARLRDPDTPPVAVIERLVAGSKELRGRAHPPVLAGGDPNAQPVRLRVGPELRGLLEFHYTSPSFADAERMRFRYRLVGHEAEWHESETRRIAYYTSLKPGDYRFEVLAGNRFGIWSEQPAALEIALAPRFRETRGFLLVVLVAVVVAGLALHLQIIRFRRRFEDFRRRQSLDAERTRIARDLHDDLGAGLAAVAFKVAFANQRIGDGQDVRSLLDQIGESARELVSRVREAVWALNPSCDSLDNVATFLSEWIEDIVASAGLECRIDVPTEFPRAIICAERRHGLVLAVKEAVSNALRHARATEIHFRLAYDGGELRIEVRDNGEGFDLSTVPDGIPGLGLRGGNGLANLHQRLRSLGGRCTIESAPGLGTTITLNLPLPPQHL